MRSYRISPVSPVIGVLVNRERRSVFLRGQATAGAGRWSDR